MQNQARTGSTGRAGGVGEACLLEKSGLRSGRRRVRDALGWAQLFIRPSAVLAWLPHKNNGIWCGIFDPTH